MLATLPNGLRPRLVACYQEIVRNYTERRWGPAELDGAKFCEIVYTILDGVTSGTFAATPSKPRRMLQDCQALKNRPADRNRVGDRSLRILIPRLLPVLYEIRNNRNVGHVGAEVDPNRADAEAVLNMTSWVMAELVRIFHDVALVEAQDAVEALVERRHPLIWEVEDITRVLDPDMTKADQALVLLYSKPGWVPVATLFWSVEYSSLPDFRSKVLVPRHEQRLLEFDVEAGRVKITPLGITHVEQELFRTR